MLKWTSYAVYLISLFIFVGRMDMEVIDLLLFMLILLSVLVHFKEVTENTKSKG